MTLAPDDQTGSADAEASQRSIRGRVRTAWMVGAAAFGMLFLSFAAEPLYSSFCKATGFGGTTRVATQAPKRVLAQTVRVRFDANVAPGTPLRFQPKQEFVDTHIGQTTMAFYEVTNTSDLPVEGMAGYNVAPFKAGKFFNKLECFCFREQTFRPHETVSLPIVFYVAPEMAESAFTNDVKTITLSYTYYRAENAPKKTARLEAASRVN